MKTKKQIIEERNYVQGELRSLHEAAQDRPLTADEEARWNEGVSFVEGADSILSRWSVIEAAEARGLSVAGDYDSDPIGEPESIRDTHRGRSPWDMDSFRSVVNTTDPSRLGEALRSRALDAAAKAPGMTSRQRQALTDRIEQYDNEAGHVSRYVLLTSRPEYMKAWSNALRSGAMGMGIDPKDLQVLNETQVMLRAMSLTNNAGGYAVPQQLDPTLILTSDGTLNPFRAISRVVLSTTNVWTGLSASDAAWSWDAEAAEVSDDTPTWAQPTITCGKAQGFIPFSIEIEADYPGFVGDVQRLLARGKDSLEGTAFATGSGTNQPIGIITALTGTGSVVTSTTTDTFAVADIYKVDNALPARYRANATWVMNRSIMNLIRAFGTADSHALITRLGEGVFERLIGFPVRESDQMDGTVTAAAENYIAVLGDFENYVIADRQGFHMELVPQLLGSNRRPEGRRGYFAYYRVGADSVNDAGFRMLNVT